MLFKIVNMIIGVMLMSNIQALDKSDPHAQDLLQGAMNSLEGSNAISDATLNGTIEVVAGPDDEFGTVLCQAIPAASSAQITLSTGTQTEVHNVSSEGIPLGLWVDPNNITHRIPYHNLLTEPVWFFPAFAIQRRLADPSGVAIYVGTEEINGQPVEHIYAYQIPIIDNPEDSTSFRHLTRTDFFIDPTTNLPVVISFNTHPDNNEGIDIPVQIRFSNYQKNGTAQTPLRIQKFVNNVLILDMQLKTVALNTGITPNTFAMR